jgi:hypothetical protein
MDLCCTYQNDICEERAQYHCHTSPHTLELRAHLCGFCTAPIGIYISIGGTRLPRRAPEIVDLGAFAPARTAPCLAMPGHALHVKQSPTPKYCAGNL